MSSSKKRNLHITRNEAIVGLIAIGILLRFFVMSKGYNYDFESYLVVGKVAADLKNVYANTGRYNYGPLFFIIQGTCYEIARVMPTIFFELSYRVMIVSVLIIGDLTITFLIKRKYGIKYALLFFLNPVSIYISGYHNQFDNLAVALLIMSMFFYNKDESFNKNDLFFIVFFSLSLMMKHICFMIPLWLLMRKNLPIKKKIVYSVIPVLIFLLSFVPFVLFDRKAMMGVLNNVFLYRSYNVAPLLKGLYDFVGMPESLYFVVFVLIMAVMGIITRCFDYDHQAFVYLICMVAFSSASADQYLAIPVASLAVLSKKTYWVYFFAGLIYFYVPYAKIANIMVNYKDVIDSLNPLLYSMMCWILVIALVEVLLNEKKKRTQVAA